MAVFAFVDVAFVVIEMLIVEETVLDAASLSSKTALSYLVSSLEMKSANVTSKGRKPSI